MPSAYRVRHSQRGGPLATAAAPRDRFVVRGGGRRRRWAGSAHHGLTMPFVGMIRPSGTCRQISGRSWPLAGARCATHSCWRGRPGLSALASPPPELHAPASNRQVSTGLIFTWSDAERAHAYSVTSLDGGLSFGPVVPIVLDDTAVGTGAQAPAVFAAPAYDPVADRLVAIWSMLSRGAVRRVASHPLRQLERAGE